MLLYIRHAKSLARSRLTTLVVVERVLSLLAQSGNRPVSLCTRCSSKVSRDIARGL